MHGQNVSRKDSAGGASSLATWLLKLRATTQTMPPGLLHCWRDPPVEPNLVMECALTQQTSMLQVCSFWHTSKVHQRLFEQLYIQTGNHQLVLWPSKSKRDKPIIDALPFGTLIELPCLGLDTSLSSVWRGTKILRSLQQHGLLKRLRATEIIQIHSHCASMDGFAGDLLSRELGDVPHAITFRSTDIRVCFKYRPHATWSLRSLVKRADTLMTISHGDVKRVAQKLGISTSDLKPLGSGVDDEFASKALLAKPVDVDRTWKLLTTCMRGQSVKRVDLTIDASVEAARLAKVDTWALSVLGMSEADFGHTFPRYKLTEEIRKHVNFIGKVDSRDGVRDVMCGHGLLVLPSKETFGIAYLEAISQCTPVIYLDTYGIDGVFEAGTVGLGVERQAISCLAETIVSCTSRFNGVLGPFDTNPVEALTWPNLARKCLSLLGLK